jgi:hypothetical protein
MSGNFARLSTDVPTWRSAGYGYLVKNRVAEGSRLADAIRSVASGGTALDPVSDASQMGASR